MTDRILRAAIATLALVAVSLAFYQILSLDVPHGRGARAATPGRAAPEYTATLDLTPSIRDLASDEDKDRDAALDRLESLGVSALPALGRALEEEDVDVRQSVIEVLSQMRTPESLPLLTRAVRRDSDKDVRYESIDLLRQLGDLRARDTIEAALWDPVWDVRLGAARACAGLCASPAAIDRLGWMAVYDEPVQSSIWARSSLVKLHRSEDPEIARNAESAMRAHAGAGSRPDAALETRGRAALLSSDLRDRSAAAPLAAALEAGGNPLFLVYVIYALGDVGDASSVPALVRTLSGPRPDLQAYAYDALRRLSERDTEGAREALAGYTGQAPPIALRSPLP